MPLWTLKELGVAADPLSLDLDEDEIEASFAHFGGVARTCFHMDRDLAERDDAKLLDAIDSITSKDKLINLLKSRACSPERHRLLQFKVIPEQSVSSFTRVIASQFVKQELLSKLFEMSESDRASLITSLQGIRDVSSLRGFRLEAMAHDFLHGGASGTNGKLMLLQLEGAAPVTEVVDIVQTDGVEKFVTISPDLAQTGPYHIPQSKQLASIDLFYLPKIPVDAEGYPVTSIQEWIKNHGLLLLQMTVAASHPAKGVGLLDVLDKLGVLKEIEEEPSRAALIFIVPKGMEHEYKRQTIDTPTSSGKASVTEIKGISARYGAKLNAKGIYSVDDLDKAINGGQITSFKIVLKRHQEAVKSVQVVTNIPQYVCGISCGI